MVLRSRPRDVLSLDDSLRREVARVRSEIREGRFQRIMVVMTIFAAIVTGFESYSQHLRGAFSNWLMWTPVWLTLPVTGSATVGLFSERVARTALPISSAVALVDGLVGFAYHLRGIRRLPGGFGLGQYNVIMGPPVFAPVLACMVGALGLLASALRRGRWEPRSPSPTPLERAQRALSLRRVLPGTPRGPMGGVSHGELQRRMALAAAFFGLLTGGEAYFEHLRGSFSQRWMWVPVWVTFPMVALSMAAVASPRVARQLLPPVSVLTFVVGVVGSLLHLRGVHNMPGGLGNLRFNITMGPPLFAPALFSAVGLFGLIAALARRRG